MEEHLTAQQKISTDASVQVKERKSGLALLREPFPAHQISKLPKATKKQTEEVKADFKKGIRCQLCGQWHHPQVVHLDYVGHAALTDRLLDCDPNWNWEPVAFNERGAPLMDESGGMWIKLTVCGQTRLGYGHADGKRGGDAIKEVIGDALRNAAMRFGAALDLWHKGDLHGPSDEPNADELADDLTDQRRDEREEELPKFNPRAAADRIITRIRRAEDIATLSKVWMGEKDTIFDVRNAAPAIFDELNREKESRKAKIGSAPAMTGEILDDQIPY